MKIKYLMYAILLSISTISYADTIPDKIKLQNINVVKAAAKGLSEKLPQKVDNYTSLVKVTSKGEKLLYTFEINDPKMSDKEIAKKGEKKMKKPVTNGICNSSKRFLQSGIDISYIYKSAKTKKTLFKFDITQKDCI